MRLGKRPSMRARPGLAMRLALQVRRSDAPITTRSVLTYLGHATRTAKYHARGLGQPTLFMLGKTAKYRAPLGVTMRLAFQATSSRPNLTNSIITSVHTKKRGKPHKRADALGDSFKHQSQTHDKYQNRHDVSFDCMSHCLMLQNMPAWQTCC